ncbi:integrase core domain-containing protein [uncultured Oscillibacter sp.]|uniref:integrase core domain-containing protein n=1 Tax=uncultured Oscillibacter sp. TaxID=876091 RepID=UPI00345BFBC9
MTGAAKYISKALTALFQSCAVKQFFSASARPLDNTVAEAFFSTFKREEAYRREYSTSEGTLKRNIQFYNEIRPHQMLNYKTPQAFEDIYWERLTQKWCPYGDLM